MFLNTILCLKLKSKCLLREMKNIKSKKKEEKKVVCCMPMCLELQVINGAASFLVGS